MERRTGACKISIKLLVVLLQVVASHSIISQLITAEDLNELEQIHRSLVEEADSFDQQADQPASLDEEDRRLIAKFYEDSERGDHQLSHQNSEALLDSDSVQDPSLSKEQPVLSDLDKQDGWTIDPQLILNNVYPQTTSNSNSNFSPTMKLLTTYNPIRELEGAGNQLAGATVTSKGDGNLRASLRSKSAADAVKMHDDMLRDPPRDGKVRVRMYYHRAIHDDARLYGTGPWKYWGHGYGVEFGYDPKDRGKKNAYQRGYTIERAFGRDFCKNKEKCRKADPNFFKSLRDAGKYSDPTTGKNEA